LLVIVTHLWRNVLHEVATAQSRRCILLDSCRIPLSIYDVEMDRVFIFVLVVIDVIRWSMTLTIDAVCNWFEALCAVFVVRLYPNHINSL
jgi:hypothetical protein